MFLAITYSIFIMFTSGLDNGTIYPMPRNTATARRQLDVRFQAMRPVARFSKPASGWIRAIRQSLGMTAAQLAARMGVSQPRIVALEHSEAEGAVNLKTLQRAAQALNCTLVYALVPREPLEQMVHQRALEVAADRLASVQQTMRLEDQEVSDDEKTHLHEVAENLAKYAPRSLWTRP